MKKIEGEAQTLYVYAGHGGAWRDGRRRKGSEVGEGRERERESDASVVFLSLPSPYPLINLSSSSSSLTLPVLSSRCRECVCVINVFSYYVLCMSFPPPGGEEEEGGVEQREGYYMRNRNRYLLSYACAEAKKMGCKQLQEKIGGKTNIEQTYIIFRGLGVEGWQPFTDYYYQYKWC